MQPRRPGSGELAALIASVVGRGGHLRIKAVGNSMEPAIFPGDVLVLGPVHSSEPRPGQIALSWNGARLTAHRVVECRAETVLTRGDACSSDDPEIPRTQILAVVRSVHAPWIRQAARLVRRLVR